MRDGSLGGLGHGVLLVVGAPCQLSSLTGQEHGRTIPLADITAVRPSRRWCGGRRGCQVIDYSNPPQCYRIFKLTPRGCGHERSANA
jgi:hypothetical protein